MKYEQLGATLYVPACRDDLLQVVNGRRFHGVRSLILCTEDAVCESDLDQALANIEALLPILCDVKIPVFVRVRNHQVLKRVLAFNSVHHLAGVVLPKFDTSNASAYLDTLTGCPTLLIMPTLETKAVFSSLAMDRLRDLLLDHPMHKQILALRIGGNDLMALLGIRRHPQMTIYETLLGPVISRLVTTFRPFGFPLTAPVCDSYSSLDVLEREVEQDLVNGLYSKTAIHPNQVVKIQSLYAVSDGDLEIAQRLLLPGQKAVFGHHGVMHELETHLTWAESVVHRSKLFGTRNQMDRRHISQQHVAQSELQTLLKESG